MEKKDSIVQYTTEELQQMQAAGTFSDWERAAAMTEEEIEAAIASDPDEADMVIDWGKATISLPEPKAAIYMRIDRDVLEFFKSDGRGYQTRINAILRAYKDAHTTMDRHQ